MDHSYSTTATTTASATPVRPGTPDTIGDAITPVPRVNPFASPYGSMPASATGSSTALHMGDRVPGRFFHSRRVRKGEVERPWLDKKDPKEKWVTIIPLIGILVGLAVSGFLVWDGLRTVVNHTYCPVLDEDWSGGINRDVWTREQEVGGFGLASSLPIMPKRALTDRVQQRPIRADHRLRRELLHRGRRAPHPANSSRPSPHRQRLRHRPVGEWRVLF